MNPEPITAEALAQVDRIEALAADLLSVLRDHYQRGPTSRDRVYESIAALAAVSGLALRATDLTETEPMFLEIFRKNSDPNAVDFSTS